MGASIHTAVILHLLLLVASLAFARNVVEIPSQSILNPDGQLSGGSKSTAFAIKTSVRFNSVLRASADNTSASITAASMGQTLVGTVQIGTPPISVTVQFDTGSASFWITSSLCKAGNACPPTSPVYNPDTSTTAKTINNTLLNRDYGDGTSVKCLVISDTLVIAGVAIPNQSICSATAINYPSMSSEDGLIGLAPPHYSNDPADVFSNLKNVFPQNKVNFYYNRNVNSLESNTGLVPNAGEITFGAPDPNRFTGNFKWMPIVTTESHWAVAFDSVTINGRTTSASKISALFDTGTSLIYLNQPIFNAVNSAMGGVKIRNSDIYQVDCTKVKSFPPVTFTFNGNSFTLNWDQQVIVLQGQTCISLFSASGDLPTIFGASFLRQFYTSFDYTGLVGLAPPTGSVKAMIVPSTSGFKNSALSTLGGSFSSLILPFAVGVLAMV
ncbi:hypothetical protein QVD99_008628 [Batrachochytrium dendrobatidis]|nr:hypothetical protein QVD99_008628 [Batrachochytrium dendrobatidis]